MSQPDYLACQISVVGKRWTVYFCPKSYFKRRHKKEFKGKPSGTAAFVVCDDRKMYLRTSSLKRETIVHELTHSYLWELCLWSLRHKDSEAPIEEVEEAFCEMMAKYGKQILKQTESILQSYRSLKKRCDANDLQDT